MFMTSNLTESLLINYLNQLMKNKNNNIDITTQKFIFNFKLLNFGCLRHHRNQTCAMLAELLTSPLSLRSGKKKRKLKARKRPTNTLKGPGKAIK